MSEEHEDYAHIRDPQAQRTRKELWAIVIIVAVVIIGGLVWRVAAHKPAAPQAGYNVSTPYPPASTAAAAAGVHPTSAPVPAQPAGP